MVNLIKPYSFNMANLTKPWPFWWMFVHFDHFWLNDLSKRSPKSNVLVKCNMYFHAPNFKSKWTYLFFNVDILVKLTLNWRHYLFTTISWQLFSWSTCWSKGSFFQDVHEWSIWIWFGPTNETKQQSPKCVDDVQSHKVCSRMDDHGMSHLQLGLL
jgi:hypothetical protein